MSALLADQLIVPPRPMPKQWGEVERKLARLDGVMGELRPSVLLPTDPPPTGRRLSTPLDFPSTSEAVPHPDSWRLTDRGIGVILALVVVVFVAGLVTAVGGFLAVSDAPLVEPPTGQVAVAGATR